MFAFVQDVKYTLRALLRAPLFMFAVIVPLALGIGANTAIFSVADALLRQPLPFAHMDRLVLMTETSPARPDANAAVSTANYLDWTTQSKSFESLAAFAPEESALTGIGNPEPVTMANVTNNFFSTLGITPLKGRVFAAGELTGDQENSIVLSYGFWERRFGGNSDIVGKELTIDSAKYTVVGILKKSSGFPVNTDVWRPLVLGAKEIHDRESHRLQILGRIKSGVPLPKVQAEMKQIASQLGKAYPDTNQGWGSRVFPLSDFVSGGLTARYTLMMMGAVFFVLLIVCSNIANLQLVRGIIRKRDWSLRYALGATRWHVIRLLLMESVTLALVSAGFAVWFANVSIRLIRVNMPPSIGRFIPGFDEISLNPNAILFTLSIAVLSGVVSGLLPALYSSRTDINKELKEGGKGSLTDRSHRRLSTYLLITEVAVTLILLVGTGLMVRGSASLRQSFEAMQPNQVLTARTRLSGSQYVKAPDSLRFYQRLMEQLASIPGVASAAIATNIPYGSNSRSAPLVVQGAPTVKAGERNSAMVQSISPGFFQAMEIPVQAGRTFQASDDQNAPPVAIVNRQLARHYWPNQDPVGRELRLAGLPGQTPWLRVVGVADDVRYNWVDSDSGYVVYRPWTQAQLRSAYILLRAQGGIQQFSSVLREKVAAIDQDQPVAEVQSWDEVISESMTGLSYVRVMMLVLAVLAIVVASVGIYGLMSYTVATKRAEIGMRMALGAQRGQILRMIISKGMLITNLGLVIGLLGSVLLTRMLSSLVFGISALDPVTFLGAAVIFILVGLLASYLPARQASQLDPLHVFRTE